MIPPPTISNPAPLVGWGELSRAGAWRVGFVCSLAVDALTIAEALHADPDSALLRSGAAAPAHIHTP